jgi:hypothetical protein
VKTLFRISLTTGLLGVLLVGGTYACPRLTAQLGLNVAELIDLQHRLDENLQQAEELNRLSLLVYHTVLLREQVMDELRYRGLDLIEAAARFREISRQLPPEYRQFVQQAYPSPTADESYCRQVIHYLRNDALYHPEVGATAAAMETELSRRLQDGPIQLPEWRPASVE